MRRVLDRLLCLLGWPARHRRRNRHKLLLLMYHGVVPERLDPFCWHQLPVDDFRAQLEWLREQYTVLPLTDALAALDAGTLPDHAAAITFDDGFANNVDVALPVLEAMELPATIFLPTELIGTADVPWPDRVYLALAYAQARSVDLSAQGLGVLALGSSARRAAAIARVLGELKQRAPEDAHLVVDVLESKLGLPPEESPFSLMDWATVKRLHAHPLITLAAHSRTHPILSRCSDARVADEVLGSQRDIEQRLGAAPPVFAYPNGRLIDFDQRAKDAVLEAGMSFAVSTVNGLVDGDSDPLALPRMCIGSDLGLDRFKLLVSGAWGR